MANSKTVAWLLQVGLVVEHKVWMVASGLMGRYVKTMEPVPFYRSEAQGDEILFLVNDRSRS